MKTIFDFIKLSPEVKKITMDEVLNTDGAWQRRKVTLNESILILYMEEEKYNIYLQPNEDQNLSYNLLWKKFKK